ncbi:restriction endonuclease subunit S [Wenyingzhuangia sp. 1_MG-2023]|nr:restriction endonuclease subunit S [Wenyingzhuangia sp. 1_MG-2023]
MKDNWNELTIGNEINLLGGFPFSSSKFNEDGDGVPLIRIRDLLKSSQETYFSGSYSNIYLINEGDVLIGMDGDFHIVKWKNSPSLLNQRILKVSGKKSGEIDIDFLFYYLKPFLLDVHNKTAATTVKHLSTFDVSRAVDLFPPLPQQQKIAKILTTVDTVIEKTESAIAKYQAIKQGLMHDLFTRGIDVNTGKLRPTPQDAPELYKESALGWIPRDWEVKKINEISSLVTNGFVGVATPFYTNRDNGILYLFGTNIRANYLDYRDVRYVTEDFHKKQLKSQLKEGDMLTVQSGHIGTSAVIPANYEQVNCHALIITRFDKEIINSNFICHYLNSDLGMKRQEVLFVGSTIKHINTSDLAKHKVFVPNKREQDEAVRRLINVQQNTENEQSTLAKYQQLKAGLLQDLLTGKVEVNV